MRPSSSAERLTESSDELFEIDETILVLVQEPEEASRQYGGVSSTCPWGQNSEELSELDWIDAILLQVRQAGVVALRCRTAGAPVTAGHVFGLNRAKHRCRKLDGPELTRTLRHRAADHSDLKETVELLQLLYAEGRLRHHRPHLRTTQT